MDAKEIKALISLLEDPDHEVSRMVEDKIVSMGEDIIPFLEEEWEGSLDPFLQERIENLVHNMQFQSVKDRLKMWVDCGAEDLLEGMWIVATYQYPDLDKASLVEEVEQLFHQVWLEMREEMTPLEQIKALNNALFKNLRFSANTRNFHSPANSMLNQVLESRKGNPITLSVIYMLVARKLDMPVYGVNLPNLFVTLYKSPLTDYYINPFNRGLVFSRKEIDSYLRQLKLEPKDSFYEPCTNYDIVRRTLKNLSYAYSKLNDEEKVEEVNELVRLMAE